MSIDSFQFADTQQEWGVQEFGLTQFNLLVGHSGAGKTRILSALRAVSAAAMGRATTLYGCQWALHITTEDCSYDWTAATARRSSAGRPALPVLFFEDDDEPDGPEHTPLEEGPTFDNERVVRNGKELLRRDSGGIVLHGSAGLALKTTESAVSLLREDAEIRPLFQHFQRVLLSRASSKRLHMMYDPRRYEFERDRFAQLEALRADTRLPLVFKAWIMQERFGDEFRRMVQEYRAIFDSVEDVRIARGEEFLPESERQTVGYGFQFIDLAIREHGVSRWIRYSAMSSGMQRTLHHLLELELAPQGSVVLVDEYENSLGVNCLPLLTDYLVQRRPDIQFILTSHHPYVIDNLDRSHWRVVTRRGGQVLVRDASQIRALDTRSRQSAFIQLLNALAGPEPGLESAEVG